MAIPYSLDKDKFDEWIVPDPGVTRLIERLAVDLKEACLHMDAEKLTEDQKVAVAMQCGVKWECRLIPPKNHKGSFELQITTDPCAIMVQDGKWHVYTRSKQP